MFNIPMFRITENSIKSAIIVTNLNFKIFLLLLLSSCWSYSKAQQYSEFQDLSKDFYPLQSRGDIPEEFVKYASHDYDSLLAHLPKDDKEYEVKKEYYEKIAFVVNELIVGGHVIFNDTVGHYLNVLKDRILEGQEELRANVKVYFVKSPKVNAFAFGNGTVVVFAGLLARMRTEAELAFVLSHEIAHVEKRHNIDSYIEDTHIDEFKKVSYSDRVRLKKSYSRMQELEADSIGMLRVVKQGYKSTSVYHILEVLKDAHLPIGQDSVLASFLESEEMKMPSYCYEHDVVVVHGEEDYDDTFSSHPNLKTRREGIGRVLAALDTPVIGQNFIIESEEHFQYYKDLAHMECVFQHQVLHEHVRVMYEAYTLMKKYPNNAFLIKAVTRSLYTAAVESRSFNLDIKWDLNSSKFEGYDYQFAHILARVSSSELITIAYHFAKKYKMKVPDCKEYCKELLQLLWESEKYEPSDFYTEGPKIETLTEGDTSFLQYSYKEELVSNALDSSYQKFLNQEPEEEVADYISKLMVLTPKYQLYKVDDNTKSKQYLLSEKGTERFYTNLKQYMDAADIRYEVYTPHHLPHYISKGIEPLNEYMLLVTWLSEVVDGNISDAMSMATVPYIKKLREKHKVRYLMVPIINEVRIGFKKQAKSYLINNLLMPGYGSFVSYHKHHVRTQLTMAVLDLEDGSIVYTFRDTIRMKSFSRKFNKMMAQALYEVRKTKK